VREALEAFAAEAGIVPAGIVPVSALRGDNITPGADSAWRSWYQGSSLLELLETLPAGDGATGGPYQQPVQYVAREGAGTGEQPRVLWGRVVQGSVKPGDTVQVFPSGQTAKVSALRRAGSDVESVGAGFSAGVMLDRQIDVSRGDWLAAPDSLAPVRRFAAKLAWLDTEAAQVDRKYWLRHGSRWVQARIASIEHRLDIQTLAPLDAHELGINDIGDVVFELQQALPLAPYAASRVGGALIVVDPASHRTSGAVLVQRALDAA
jgi:sulfate adenylyltransferase subunit 1